MHLQSCFQVFRFREHCRCAVDTASSPVLGHTKIIPLWKQIAQKTTVAMSNQLATKEFGIICFNLQETNSLKTIYSTSTDCRYDIFQKYRWQAVAADLHMTISCSQRSECSRLCLLCKHLCETQRIRIYF